MSTMRPHRRKQAYEGDPMVPIDPPHLKAAIEASTWSIQALATATGNHSQTLDHLTKGDSPKRCRRSRRQALADKLGVPEPWLEGLSVAVPELSGVHRRLAIRLSPRLQLAVGGLLRKATKALRRDLREPDVTAELGRRALGTETVQTYLSRFLLELIRLDHWRSQLTTWRPSTDSATLSRPEASGVLWDLKDLYTEEDDRTGLAMVQVLEAALDPWFRGEARLDYDRLRVLVGYDRTGPASGPPHPRYEGQAASPTRMIPLVALGMPE